MEGELEKTVRSIALKNQRSRAEFSELSARIASLTLSGTLEEIDEFSRTLDEQVHRFHEGAGQDPATGGTDGS